MSLLSRGARAAARPSKQLLQHQPRRFDSHGAGHGNDHSHGPSAFHVDSGGTGSESFGARFYIGLALIPVSIVAYSLASSGEVPGFTRIINAYRERDDRMSRENILNQTAVEQASFDRHIFITKEQEVIGPGIGYPEALNSSSPWNVVAGQGGADLGFLVAHYTDEQKIAEEKRTAKIEDGKVKTVYDDTTGGRFPGWMPLIGRKDK